MLFSVIVFVDLFLEEIPVIYKFFLALNTLKLLLILEKIIKTVTINMEILSRNKDFLVENISRWWNIKSGF
jgi:hypothetical protein